MTAGQTALGISDIPFMYSMISIIYISITGNIEDISRFFIVGLIAGTIGTFFVFWHPIQWLIDRNLISNRKFQSTYLIKMKGHDPPQYKIKIDKWLRLSLKTSSIKYLKDKITGQIYFVIILITLLVALNYPPFLETINLNDLVYSSLIKLGLLAMLIGMAYVMIKQNIEFIRNVKIHCLYFLIFKNNWMGDESLLKSAIDLGDWDTAKEYTDDILVRRWQQLPSHSE